MSESFRHKSIFEKSRDALIGAIIATQSSGCLMIHIGRSTTIESGGYKNELDRFESKLERTNDVRDRLRDCVLNAPSDLDQFENTSQERFGGIYEKGKFIYEDERGQKVNVKVESEKGPFTRSEEVRVWGTTQEEALKACEDAY